MRVLDLYCGAGGAGMGYHQAGFEVVGVDIKPQSDYPFEFIQADAFEVFQTIGGQFDLIHASPPCQGYSWGTRRGREKKWPTNIIYEIRELFGSYMGSIEDGTWYVIENIENARRDLLDPIRLCGTMFGLPLLKHRLFETNWGAIEPPHNKHTGSVVNGDYVTVAGHGGNNKSGNYGVPAWQKAMQIDWMKTRHDLAEAIPPAYTKYIGEQFKERFMWQDSIYMNDERTGGGYSF